ncbi:translational GTPase TypA [Candidatus Berkelbacteria bacterium]|nr:translational GTPase TypA [Candidatus Berkelbacteria bacterium]
MELRNVAIIAHVDHGKTTLVDGLLKQSKTFRENEPEMGQALILDSNDQERERGITILAKNTAITYLPAGQAGREVKINIIDTPGHADFGGEVERTLAMADGALLLIDAQEGPMPQTKFVLKYALELGLKIIVVINKIDKKDARVEEVIRKTHDLFLELAKHESELDFPVYFAIGRDGKAWDKEPHDFSEPADLSPLFKGIIEHVPAPVADEAGAFQMVVTTLDWDSYQGKYAIGRIARGSARPGLKVTVLGEHGASDPGVIDAVYVSQGLKRVQVPAAAAGDIVALTGFKNAKIGDTIADALTPEALPRITIAPPTLKMAVSANTSPFVGREGKFVTSRQILERIERELETNVSLKMELSDQAEFLLSGRGELHLSVLIETLRREGYELQVGKPTVITQIQDGKIVEPIEELTVDVGAAYAGAVTAEVGRRRGLLIVQSDRSDGTVRLMFEITTRGLLGLRNQLLTISRGTAVMNSFFVKFASIGAPISKLRNGVLIASEAGKAVTYGLNIAQGRGATFIEPQTQVYKGMIIGLNSREEDIEINVTKEKKMTNVRASTSDISVILAPPVVMSLEQCLDFLEDDELLEVTPKSLRLRKKILDTTQRARQSTKLAPAAV